ncbi:hypothetical protein KY290_027604 [Solanum tuberosum]|uniref:Uncharacterized protein n=1 Tax=Solanum tuberosum TaxID=4113 RepID=A0ABQ7UHB3_SOLTU|nr:hypothetical protein KY285_026560 [Solanum tuberosum]KAH0748372.1 hypothetical protein KY290_027604 [Solanum tuberosum]
MHANLGMSEITLNAGTVFVTIFQNFNMSLHDLYLTEALKIHVQILGAPQARDAIQATLHYQLAWRVQNHVMDLSLPGGQDALFLNVDATNRTTQCTQIPRHIPWDIDCNCTECEEDYYGSEDDDEVDYDEYSYDRAKWDEEEYQFLVSHKPQDWPALPTP